MSTNKVFFHTGAPCNGCGGIGEMWRALNAAGVPFGVYSVEGGGLIAEAAAYPKATLVYRTLATDVAPYELEPVAAGQIIGYTGASGNATGVHLHLTLKRAGHIYTDQRGVRWPSNIFDPTPYLERFWPAGMAFDLLPYLRGDGRLYEVRHPTGATETLQTQIEGEKFYLVKNSQYEELWVDNDYVWRGVDTSPGGGRFYVQREAGKPGARWCPRRMRIGETWIGTGHHVQFYDKATCAKSAANSGQATNRMTLVARHGSREWNGVVVEDVVELTNGQERWWFGRGFGLVAWASGWGSSAIAAVHAEGARPDNVREKLNCAY